MFFFEKKNQKTFVICPAFPRELATALLIRRAIRYHRGLWDTRKKDFFFEKKKQKTFAILHCTYGSIRFVTLTEKSFLVLFFKKEHSCFLRVLPI